MSERQRPFTLAEAGKFILQALDGLQYLHEQGIIHRDLNPRHILFSQSDDKWTAKLTGLDFAIACKYVGEENVGDLEEGYTYVYNDPSFGFIAREQIISLKNAVPASDVWSMAAISYYLLTRETPREHKAGVSIAEAIMRGRITPLRERDSSIPVAVAAVIERALETEVKHRYQTAADFKNALMQVL